MTRRKSRFALALGLLSLIAALAPAPQEPGKGAPLKELAEARAKVCERMLDYYRVSAKAPAAVGEPILGHAGRYAANYEPIELWSRRLVDAKLDAAVDLDGRIAVLESEVKRIEKFAAELKELAKGEPEWRFVSDQVEFYRLDAEYRLAKQKAGR